MGQTVTLYTDGACKGNPGPGGWGVVLRYGEALKTLLGGEAETTNNRMELQGAIEGLQALHRQCEVHLYTDSQYVRRGVTEWMPRWKKNGWKTADRKPVKNVDLWLSWTADKQVTSELALGERPCRCARQRTGRRVGQSGRSQSSGGTRPGPGPWPRQGGPAAPQLLAITKTTEPMRQIVLDTETTGLDPLQGHRIIEIGCVEIIERKLTGRHFHVYINPEREVEDKRY